MNRCDHLPRWIWLMALVVPLAGVGCGKQEPSRQPQETSRQSLETPAQTQTLVIGEAFGNPVTAEQFQYYYKTAALFTRTDTPSEAPRTEKEIRLEAWQDLIYLTEANRLGVTIEEGDLKAELKRLMVERGVEYGGPQYVSWIHTALREDVGTFEHRIEELLRINAFMAEKTSPDVTVTEAEMQEKFLNQYNSFESEYISFDTREGADAFLDEVRANPVRWKETFDATRAADGQQGGAWINIMSLEALIDLWKIPTEDAYRILGTPEGEFVVAKQFYGDAVFRVLWTRHANLEDYTDEKQEHYRNVLTRAKQYRAVKAYFEELLERADYRDFVQEQLNAEEEARLQEKIARLKERSSIVLKTNQGTIELRLFPDIAPKASENFIELVAQGYYDGLTFHRVKKDFMIQGGDPTGTGTGGESIWDAPFEDEVSGEVVFDRPGLLAMANSGPNTNASQFFITTAPTAWLNGKHTIFGEVVAGLDVVKAIEGVETDAAEKPLEEQRVLEAILVGR